MTVFVALFVMVLCAVSLLLAVLPFTPTKICLYLAVVTFLGAIAILTII